MAGLIEKQLAREAAEESGLQICDPHYLENLVFIRPDGIPVALIQYAVKYKSGRVGLAPEFDVCLGGRKRGEIFECIDGIAEGVTKATKHYSTQS